MNFLATKDNFYVQHGPHVLRCCKKTAKLYPVPFSDVENDAVHCGEVVGVVGKIELEDEGSFLLVITQASPVAQFHTSNEHGAGVLRIERVRAVPLVDDGKITRPDLSAAAGRLKSSQKAIMKFVQDKIANGPMLLDEVLRLFNDVPDFYISFERDLTHSTQRYFSHPVGPDERFFWNRILLSDLLEENINAEMARPWLVPIIQGHVGQRDLSIPDEGASEGTPPIMLRLLLVSRRAVTRAGCRYLRRGIDADSNVANAVETELIVNIMHHHLSFVQVRGSVPVFWAQRGMRYRPPLTITKTQEESQPVFNAHMNRMREEYGSPVVAVSLVDQNGRELELATSYIEHSMRYDQKELEFFSFDFHNHCRGMQFEKVSVLINAMEDSLNSLGFCWVDKTGEVVRRQTGVVRTNCVDCLDRTNVVQGSISQWVCMRQAQRLGVFGPLQEPPEQLVQALQMIWADNGDAISRQYAGTAALKGDMTRYGERKFTGIMKDGMNSASRYYLSQVRDADRQRAINALLRLPDLVEETPVDSEQDEDDNVARLVNETSRFLLPEGEVSVAGWALVESTNPGDSVDTVLLLTRANLYAAVYDDEAEKLEEVRIVPLDDIQLVEIGRIGSSGRQQRVHIRVSCPQGAWAWRAANTRLFNNVPIRIKNGDEADEYAESIAEQLRVTAHMCTGRELPIARPQRLQASGPPGVAAAAGKKVLAGVTSMFKRGSGSSSTFAETSTAPKPPVTPFLPPEKSPSKIAEPCLIDLSSPPSQHSKDDLELPYTLDVPTSMRPSQSESGLSEKAGEMVSRLRLPLFRANATTSPVTSPFVQLEPFIAQSKSKIILL